MSEVCDITQEILAINYRARLIMEADTPDENAEYIKFALWRTRQLRAKRKAIYGK